ncbi:MAG: glycosyltransferase family 2 protein [Rikenellaceae bacterium]|jgi:hypothetical protein|nr:glycosyltransferase family 2 protein [Rikenellaceae bacterium]
MFETPILFLVFNRVDTTRRVFNAIREQKPRYLYLAADGPRKDREGEAEKCRQVREIVGQVDWDCEVKTLFRDENLGCGKAVSTAITWFFDQVEQGIVLEDDCLPHPDFFPYCEQLLERYKDDPTVMFIAGGNYQNGVRWGDASYYFSAITHVWGWAGWRTTWEKYDYDLNKFPARSYRKAFGKYFPDRSVRRYWNHVFKQMRQKRIDTWDYQLGFSIIRNHELTIIPNSNLICNIGLGPDATHPSGQGVDEHLQMPTQPILPLRHPDTVKHDYQADMYFIRREGQYITLKALLKKYRRKLRGQNPGW